MRLPTENTAAKGRSHCHRANEVICRPIPHARSLAYQLIKPGVYIIGKLDFGHRTKAISGHANANTDNAAFANRRIKHARLAMLHLQAGSCAKNAAEIANIFPHDDDFRVFGKHDIQRTVDGLDHIHLFCSRLCHQRASHSGPNLSFCSSSIWAHCSFKCHGMFSKTSSNIVSNGWCKPWPKMPFCSASF